MLVRFWGTRGSLPVAAHATTVQAKIARALVAAAGRTFKDEAEAAAFAQQHLDFATYGAFGGATSCVEIEGADDAFMVCDLGSGVREFGIDSLKRCAAGRPRTWHVFLSHMHWDHIMGFPLFVPAYIPGNVIRIHGCHDRIREAFERQQSDPCFPFDFRDLRASIEFVPLEPGDTVEVAGFAVTPIKQNHAGDSYGYRFTRLGKTIVYSTDCEHKYSVLDESYPFIGFYRNADLLIFDAMYSLADTISASTPSGCSSAALRLRAQPNSSSTITATIPSPIASAGSTRSLAVVLVLA